MKLIASRTVQWPLVAEFTFSPTDTMNAGAGGSGAEQDLTPSGVFEIIPLPPGAVVTGGSVDTEVAMTGGTTITVAVGDSDTADRYLSATDAEPAGTTALVPTGYRGVGENIWMTLAVAGTYTGGTITVRVEYVVAGRSNEVQVA